MAAVGTPRESGASNVSGDTGGYNPAFYEALYAAEDRHFWFRARNRIISIVASQVVSGLAPGYRVLEIGCGNGNVIRHLEKACANGVVIGMDLFGEGLKYARQRSSSLLVQADASRTPFRTRFELVGAFDVLEHIPDDVGVLRQLRTLISPGGVLLITVPAHQSLWSYFDEASHHCRRYEPDELSGKLFEAGYTVEFLSHYMASIYPLIWLGRRLAGRTSKGRDGEKPSAEELAKRELTVNPAVNLLLRGALAVEAPWIARRRRLSIGSSLVAVARNTEASR